jgi:ribosome-associated toxin RatA of RatAB toxin-antitoxin module
MFGGTIFSLSSGYFSGKYALSRERRATSMAEWVFILRWRSLPMHKTNSIIMCAPRMTIFETAANLELWPRILPHYRYIRYLEHSPSRNVVVMAATRSGIPISWTSEQIIDLDRVEVRFHHLKAFTKGMRVVWTFQEVPDGVLVEIKHDLAFRVKILEPIADKIIGDFFIHHIANKTLRCMKSYVETSTNKVIA